MCALQELRAWRASIAQMSWAALAPDWEVTDDDFPVFLKHDRL